MRLHYLKLGCLRTIEESERTALALGNDIEEQVRFLAPEWQIADFIVTSNFGPMTAWLDELKASLIGPPYPPLGRVARATSARLVAHALVCDGEDQLAPRLVRAIRIWEASLGREDARPSATESQSRYAMGLRQNLEDAARWEDAAKAVRDLIAGGRYADILEEQLVAAYMRKGYN